MFETKLKQLAKWEIFVNKDKTELMFTNGLTSCYAYLEWSVQKGYYLSFDRITVPKYVQTWGLSWAKKNLKTL